MTKVRNTIVHEGSSFEFTLDDNLFVRRKEQSRERITAADWAHFDIIEPVGSKIVSKVARALFDLNEQVFTGGQLHDNHPDTAVGYAVPGGRHKAYERIIGDIEAIEDDGLPTESKS